MDINDLDIYLKKFNDYEYITLENLMRTHNFKDVNSTLEDFDSIKISDLESEYIGEIPCWYLEKLSFSKHSRFTPMPSHKHSFIEISYVYSGEINEVINGTPVTLKEGDLIILDTNVIHSIGVTGLNDIMLNFPISKEYFKNSFFNQLDSNNIMTNFILRSLYESHKYNSYLIFHTQENKFIHDIICKLAQEFISPNLNSNAIIDSCIIILFAELLRIYESQREAEDNNDLSKQNKLAIDIANYISSNYETISLASAAEHFNFTPNYFSNIVKKYTGKKFQRFSPGRKIKKSLLSFKEYRFANRGSN